MLGLRNQIKDPRDQKVVRELVTPTGRLQMVKGRLPICQVSLFEAQCSKKRWETKEEKRSICTA